jgi:O-antigen ligase
MSGREELAQADLRLWLDNPVFGIGLGMSPYGHLRYHGSVVATHNEFTRLLAEHGLFGVVAIIAIGVMAIRAVTSARNLTEKALVSSMATWGLLFSGANGMRIAAAGFIFGMAFLRLREREE